ncbi:MAG: CHAT domain-containing tetratricopeptide repeat protein, partial [bacterium]
MFNNWIASGFSPDKFPAIPDSEKDLEQFVIGLIGEISGLDEKGLETVLGLIPALLRDKVHAGLFADYTDRSIDENLPVFKRVLLCELVVDFLILSERWSECIPRLDDLINIASDSDLKEELAILFNYRGVCQYRLSKFKAAREDLEASLQLAENLGSVRHQARACINLGLVMKEMGKLENAAPYYKTALDLARKGNDTRTVLSCYLNIGNIYRELMRWPDGRRALESGIRIASEIGDRREEIRGKLNLGVLVLEEGKDMESAAILFREVIDEALEIGADQIAGVARRNLSDALLKLGDAEGALRESEIGLEEAERGNFTIGIQRARAHIAKACDKLGQIQKADENYRIAFNIFDELWSELKTARDRMEFQRNLESLSNDYIGFCLRAFGPEIAFGRLATRKNRTLGSFTEKPDFGKSYGDIDPVHITDKIRAELSKSPDTILIDYFQSGEGVKIFVCDSEGVRIFDCVIDPEEISTSIESFKSEINLHVASKEYRDAAWKKETKVPQSLVELSAALIGPIENGLDNYRHIIFIPSAGLHDVPFQALVDSNGNYLIENHSISFLLSGDRIFASRRAEKCIPERLAVLKASSEDLPEIENELIELRRIFGKGLTVIDSDFFQMALNRVKNEAWAGEFDALHILGHAEFDDDDPFNSGIILTDDKRLSVDDLITGNSGNIGVCLVSLSACETGRGRILSGEETVGIDKAFLLSGIPCVLSSQWKISDKAASILIPAFYEAWRKGSHPHDALREAIMKMLGSKRIHPYFFA